MYNIVVVVELWDWGVVFVEDFDEIFDLLLLGVVVVFFVYGVFLVVCVGVDEWGL